MGVVVLSEKLLEDDRNGRKASELMICRHRLGVVNLSTGLLTIKLKCSNNVPMFLFSTRGALHMKPMKSQGLSILSGTETVYSWKKEETMKTIVIAAPRDQPAQKWTGFKGKLKKNVKSTKLE